ncbi:hypothetical protein GGTG_03688 [Gaeumannomyces tritici R3-111a-1]|uniref:Uncharacterized protein n=1 Tax=Gaeumannomyces tritici (strain R3-111a-1) TaxID=644352 RepID=J3NQY3_GAET3|nr:hypothetical protein GGTG_03688 [Gaeumannomyces tritici R3-111a-1]EJT78589.1 hypothetical protein GGTG_03688 [Gaeumannomyces tritici R3-111a-1]
MASLPYQRLNVCGEVVFCAQGASIHAFNLKSQAYLGTWSHPALASQRTGSDSVPSAAPDTAAKPDAGPAQSETPPTGPADGEEPDRPSKRAKLGADLDETQGSAGAADTPGLAAAENLSVAPEGGAPAQGKKKKGAKVAASSRPTDRPWVTLLEATSDGRHLVAVTGSDKTLWTFEHDGNGALKELSKRAMPKRPSSVVITADNETVISGDKFGDVYSVPLIQKETSCPAFPTAPGQGTPTPAPAARSPFKPQADETTVHSARNLRALASQKLHLEQQRQQQKEADEAAAAAAAAPPAFEHSLLLGHVSMLTSVALASRAADGRPYIVTADRDEHIRVSRGIPQPHVIEAFCLGHGEFVSALCVPAARPRLLVSGGGDPDLLVWDWLRGALLSRADLLGHVRGVCPEMPAVAVSQVRYFTIGGSEGDDRCVVVVACERVPALFLFDLTSEGVLRHVQSVSLGGNPLDFRVVRPDAQPAIITTLHLSASAGDLAATAEPLCVVQSGDSGQWTASGLCLRPSPTPVISGKEDEELSRDELEAALYNIESLRKAPSDENVEADP